MTLTEGKKAARMEEKEEKEKCAKSNVSFSESSLAKNRTTASAVVLLYSPETTETAEGVGVVFTQC